MKTYIDMNVKNEIKMYKTCNPDFFIRKLLTEYQV